MKTFTVKIYEEQICELKKENFFLKLRIFNLEEWLRNKNYDPSILSSIHDQRDVTFEGKVDCNCDNVKKREKAIQGLIQLIQKKDCELEDVRQAAETVAIQNAKLITKLEQITVEQRNFISKLALMAKQLQNSFSSNELLDKMVILLNSKQQVPQGNESNLSSDCSSVAVNKSSEKYIDVSCLQEQTISRKLKTPKLYESQNIPQQKICDNSKSIIDYSNLSISANKSTHVFREIIDATFMSTDQRFNDSSSGNQTSNHSLDSGLEHENFVSPPQLENLQLRNDDGGSSFVSFKYVGHGDEINTNQCSVQTSPINKFNLPDAKTVTHYSVEVQTEARKTVSTSTEPMPSIFTNQLSSASKKRSNQLTVGKTVTFAVISVGTQTENMHKTVSTNTSGILKPLSSLNADVAKLGALSKELLSCDNWEPTTASSSLNEKSIAAFHQSMSALKQCKEQIFRERINTSSFALTLSQMSTITRAHPTRLLHLLKQSNGVLNKATKDLQLLKEHYNYNN